jgi:hypothetical protein
VQECRGCRYGEDRNGAVSKPVADDGFRKCRTRHLKGPDMSKNILRGKKKVGGIDWIEHGFRRSIAAADRVPSRLRQSSAKVLPCQMQVHLYITNWKEGKRKEG